AARAYHAVANDALAGEWVQIGDKGPIYDDVANMLGDVYGQFGADTPEKQEIVRGLLFRYDPNYGVIANRDLVKAAVEMNNNRGGNGFFQSAIGRALVTVVATVVGGPVLAAGVSAAFTAYDGGSLGDIVTAGAAAYAGGVAGAGVGGAVTSSLASSSLSATTVAAASGFAQGVSSSFTSQLIATGRIDGDALLMSGVAGGVGGAVTTAVSGTDIVANVDSSLALAPGTTARLIGTQAGSLAGSGELNLESALLVLGSGSVNDTGGSLVVDGATPADAAISDYEARGYTSEEAEVLRSMGITPGAAPEVQRGEVPPAEEAGIQVIPTDPKTRRMMAVGNAFNTLSSNPNLTVEINQTPQGAQIIDIWTREGTQVTYAFMNGELMGVRTNLDRVATGTGARMQQVSTMADELRANPNLSINATNNYRTGTQQILITSAGQPAVQYNYQDGVFVSVSYPDQLRTTTEYVNDAARYGIPHDTARLWADRAVAGQSLVASTIPADVVATGQLATVAIHTSEPGQVGRDSASGVLAVANIDGVDRAVLITANHVVRPGESTVLSARDTMGRLVQIPFDGQTMLSTGIAGDDARVAMGSTAASDGYLVTLSPETLNAL
ncbi:MAG TPA: hypothetical protein VLC93_09205, partial [Myxococcota bacterium]|nr:hypothetical protein [Myxococcota bacterium]